MKIIKEKAFAKINLGLEVLYKRIDGYHEINTVLTAVNLFDGVTLERSDKLRLNCVPDIGVKEKDNIAWKAAACFLEAIGAEGDGFTITIEKRIPAGAGLGGGSSDAAAVLRALARFYPAKADSQLLYKLAYRLGSDVPFFLYGSRALAKGRGEILTAAEFDFPYWVVLIYPNLPVSTAWAYGSLMKNTEPKKYKNLVKIINKGFTDYPYLNSKLKNDFENTVFKKYPQLKAIKQRLIAGGAFFALLSGSGSTVYGLFDRKELAVQASRHFGEFTAILCKPFAGASKNSD